MAESIALAVLENLVHLSKQDFPTGYVTVTAKIPSDLLFVSEEDLMRLSPGAGPRDLGDQWIDSMASAVLRVHSVIVPAEFNYLINPRHSDFSAIVIEHVAPFEFDDRLFRNA